MSNELEDNVLVQLVNKHGINNLHFKIKARPLRTVAGLIAYTTSSDKEVEVLCHITEERYQLSENYKVTLTPFNDQFPPEHYYQSDLISMIRQGGVSVQDPDGRPVSFDH